MRRQFSLRSLLWVVMLAGIVCGVLAHVAKPLLFRWAPGPLVRPQPSSGGTDAGFEPSTAYFESGETPLR